MNSTENNNIQLNNIMYIDTNIYMGNINSDTYLCFENNGKEFCVKYIDTQRIKMVLHMFFENNVKLILARKPNEYTYELDINTYELNKKGLIDNKFIDNYPYNMTMSRPLYNLEYFSKIPLYNSPTFF